MDDAGLAQVFETLIATGLRNFLGCPAVFYEEALLEFFANGTVRDGLVVSTVHGVTVEISEQLFAETFELSVEGLTDLTDVPKDKIFDARSLFSASKEQVSVSCFKKEMKIEYRLLHDILAKTIFVKAGSFDAVTRDRFLLMTAITFDVKVNWGSLLFCVLKAMVTPGSRQEKGFAIQIDDLQILRLNELKKTVMAQSVTADTDSLAIRNRFNALDAKILLLDGQVAAIRSEQLEFQAKMAADFLSLSTQIGDLVDYIRGGDAKKREGSSSRRPLPAPVNQGESSGNVIRTTEIISPTDIDAAQRDIMERMMRADRERDRERIERRLSRIGSYKRRRGY
ncbi:hypothetical protein F511_29490 [Dorcoceras hygrometricum]|uniref:Dystroglycan-like n=1 Tax=Dorcoceras hygrometricum TaxID=472368 RepID=A0A2Z7CDD8_9LAMI|nr:hypothetical protein F511_29490 [Dorcoceras hygrometricum]